MAVDVRMPAAERSEFRAPSSALVEAFRGACGGYSLDRVVTDPKFQAVLQRQCQALDIPGDLRSWNAELFRLRKAGKLKSVVTTERTELTWDECEQYLPAAEAAAALLLGDDSEESLDDLLCDPVRAAEFDRLAQRYGGRKATFEYRWTALKLRKEAKVIRRRADELRRVEMRFSVPIAVARGGRLNKLPAESGLYSLYDAEGERVYLGVAANLRTALVRLLPKARWKLFERTGDVRVAVFPHEAGWTELLAYRQVLVGRARPALNWHLPGEGKDHAESHDDGPASTNGRKSRRPARAVVESAHG